MADPQSETDVLVVGAGPTGLALAAQLARFGVRLRLADKALDRTKESRALAVQARSLELLQSVGLGEALAQRGNTTTRLMLHLDRGEPVVIDLGNFGRSDTRFPYILFVSQPQTESVLREHLASQGIEVEHGVELADFHEDESGVRTVLRHTSGGDEQIHVKYLVGCDGAHSIVRKRAGIPFEGGAYPEDFALGDVEADGPLERGAIHAFGEGPGFAMFFPLGEPTSWRVMAMQRHGHSGQAAQDHDTVTTQELSLADLQAIVADPTAGSVQVRDPAWLTRFRLHHRQAAQYQKGRIFLAGDAAHVHSPVGAQGMNTGIQDAWNLGWKLALVIRGRATQQLLDSYNAERWPVGRTLLKATDRLFGLFARTLTANPLVMRLRQILVRGIVAPAASRQTVRAFAFHFVSQLGIRYRASAVSVEGEPPLGRGPKAGNRLPDAHVRVGRRTTYLQQELSEPALHLLLCGPVDIWDEARANDLIRRFPSLLSVKHLTSGDADGALVDESRQALNLLGVDTTAQYLVRPDGHIAFRSAGTDLTSAAAYLNRWFVAH
jgi:2-polyprenyl-6-methoxyphenol hydroxylase-like FAD-dependent oxidoreductase